jgi:tetratricopeptide (TPR) repeat protein
MRPLLASVVAFATIGGAASAQRPAARSGVPTVLATRQVVVTPERVDRFTEWIKAVHEHEPGERDAALERVASWSGDELRGLWADAQFLAALMRNLKVNHFEIPQPRETIAVLYKPVLLQRMRAMACAAAGHVLSADCIAIHAAENLDEELRAVAADAAADRARTGEDNYVLRRGAILHGDVETMVKPVLDAGQPAPGRPLPGPRRVRADTSDGISVDVHEVGVHWEIARTLLGMIVPRNFDRAAPGRDAMVRDWYRATAAWMQQVESHDTDHINRALELFQNDADILFLSGTLHEVYASSEIQAAAHSVAMPAGFALDIGSTRGELHQAEGFFRRALAHTPEMAEAHLRLGRVLALQGHDAEAVAELQQALTHLGAEELEYDGQLFIGAAYEALGRYDEAAAAYERAAARFPGAQSPLIALSQLARRRGDRGGALAAMARMFALPMPEDGDREDPWWFYYTVQARNADDLLERVRAPFRRSAQ